MTRSAISSAPFELNYRPLLAKSGLRNRTPETLPAYWAPNSTGLFDFSPDSDQQLQNSPSQTWTPLPYQIPPPGDWKLWLLMGGRGIGKTDTMAHYVNDHVLGPPCDKRIRGGHRIGIVAPTLGDAVKACVNGPSGLKAHNPGVRLVQGVGGAIVYWPSGAEAALFSTEDARTVDRLRAGGNRCLDWWEEFAAWPMIDDGWEQAVYGLRIGQRPRAVASTTPKNRKKLKDLLKETDTVVSHATTRDNPYLAESYREWLNDRFANTRSGRQELEGELLDDVPGALWQRKQLDDLRVCTKPELQRIVVAIDPAVTSGENSDETGIVVAGRGVDGRGYVLADRTCRLSPDGWARRATVAYDEFSADRILAEVNNGGDLVERVIRTVGRDYPYRAVRASRGKVTRAEPIAALYEQGKISHVGGFPELEDQMCSYTPDGYDGSPDRVDALVWALTDLMITPSEVRLY